MARDSDQPSTYTMDQVLEIYSHDAYSVMRLRKAPRGSRLLIPMSNGDTVEYVYGGDDYWHRHDTKGAEVTERTMVREGVESYRMQEREHAEPPLTRVFRRWRQARLNFMLVWGMRQWNPIAWASKVRLAREATAHMEASMEDALAGLTSEHQEGVK